MHTVDPTPEGLDVFAEREEPAGPLVMLNLLRFREQAVYAGGSDLPPCSGREAYQQRYGGGVIGLIKQAGGRVLYMGRAWADVIAPDGEVWDEALLVEYPSRQAFLDMVGSPAYQTVAVHRTAALLDSRLIALSTMMRSLEP